MSTVWQIFVHITVTSLISAEIPIIDFQPFLFGNEESKLNVVSDIRSSLQTVGFFLITNHGVPQYLIDAGFAMQKDFFHQNIADKEVCQKNLDNSSHAISGWYKNELLYGSTADQKETYDILLYSILNANSFDLWFTGKQLKDFYDLSLAMKTISQYMFDALSLALDGPEHLLSNIHNNFYNSYIRFVYYNSQNNRNENEMLLQPHTDFLSLTMGFQDENSGFEVWDKQNKQWVDLDYKKGTMLVNIGDAMQRWSNDRFISNFHRVQKIKNNNTERLSYYIFVGPHNEQIVDGRVFGVKDEDLLHKPTAFGQHFAERVHKTYKKAERDDHYTGDQDALLCE